MQRSWPREGCRLGVRDSPRSSPGLPRTAYSLSEGTLSCVMMPFYSSAAPLPAQCKSLELLFIQPGRVCPGVEPTTS